MKLPILMMARMSDLLRNGGLPGFRSDNSASGCASISISYSSPIVVDLPASSTPFCTKTVFISVLLECSRRELIEWHVVLDVLRNDRAVFLGHRLEVGKGQAGVRREVAEVLAVDDVAHLIAGGVRLEVIL